MQVNKIFILLISIFFLQTISASVLVIGEFNLPIEQGDCFNIPLGCDNCTWANLTITHQNGTILVSNAEMSSEDGFHYNYSFCDTDILGQYWVTFHYDEDGYYLYTERDWFEVTPTGNTPLSSCDCEIIFAGILIMLTLSLFFFLFGFKSSHIIYSIIFFTISGVFIFMSSLFVMVILENTIYQYTNIIDGYSTYIMIIKTIFTIGMLALVLYAGWIALHLWKVKRGFDS